MTNEELLAAAKVFELAVQMTERRLEKFRDSIPDTDETKKEQIDHWIAENKPSASVPEAYALLSKVSGIISDLRSPAAG